MRTSSSLVTLLLSATCITGAAHAWNPNAGAEDSPPVARYQPVAHPSVVPHPSFTPVAIAPAPAPIAYVAPQLAVIAPLPAIAEAPAPAPAYVAPQPAARAVPAQNYYEQQPANGAPAAPVGRTAYIAPYDGAPQQAAAYKANRFYIGVESFWDRYREPVVDLESKSIYGALDGGWTHYFNPSWFTTTELRGSYGKEDYKSPSGKLNGTDQWEFEGRFLGGYDLATGDRGHIKPYIGVDMRYYRDEGKGGVTNLGFNAYDRRIFQIMAPVGVTYDIPGRNGFHYLPNIEAGPLLWGNVSTRLENIPGFQQLSNQQHTGYEIRAEFMVNNLNESDRGWEFGPFLRYWHINDSNVDTTPSFTGLEPANSRLQLGAKLKYLF